MRLCEIIAEARRPRDRWVPWLQGDAISVHTKAKALFHTSEDIQAAMLIWNALDHDRAQDADKVIQKAVAFGPETYGTSVEAIQRVAHQLYDATIPELPLPMDNPVFRRWFGKSKVVDKDGEPLKVYHGTTSVITSFSKDHLGWNTGAKSAMGGILLTSSPINAGEYASGSASKFHFNDYHVLPHLQNAKSGPNIVPVYLSIQRPLIHDMRRSDYRDVSFADLIKQAKRSRKDGVIINNTYDPLLSHVFIAFKPEQIKSAIGSAYDASDQL